MTHKFIWPNKTQLFAIGKSIVSLVLHGFDVAVNIVFWKLISWLVGVDMCIVMNDFKLWCGIPSVQGAIDDAHLLISKPSMPCLKNHYYFKYGGIFHCSINSGGLQEKVY
jgi:hypothetical protein